GGSANLVHLNGRGLDAGTGRFLSPDPTIPDPGFTQSYNRYSYVNNNPLTYVDPSGFEDDLIPAVPGCQYDPVCAHSIPDGGEITVHGTRPTTPGPVVAPYPTQQLTFNFTGSGTGPEVQTADPPPAQPPKKPQTQTKAVACAASGGQSDGEDAAREAAINA